MSKPRWTIEQKRQHVAAWRASGLTRQQYCELNDIPFTSLREWPQDVAKLNAGQMNRPFFPFILRHHCMLMYHSPSRMSQSRSSFPAEYGCAVSRHNLPMSSGRSNMLSPDNVFIAIKPVDMRRGIDTLTQYIQDELRSTWHEGAAFVFVNKVRSRIKVLRWDKHGVWLCTRRLHKGSFRWPRANDAAWHLTPDEFNWLIAVLTGSRLRDMT